MHRRARSALIAVLLLSALVPLAACPRRPAADDPGEIAGAPDAGARGAGEAVISPTPEAPVADPGGEIEIDDAEGHGGSMHVHGLAAFAATLEGTVITLSLDTPLANLGLAETAAPAALKADEIATQAFALEGGASCTRGATTAESESRGDHGSLTLTATFTCTAPDDVSGVTFKGFETWSGFEQLNAVYIGPNSENAADLTPEQPTLFFD